MFCRRSPHRRSSDRLQGGGAQSPGLPFRVAEAARRYGPLRSSLGHRISSAGPRRTRLHRAVHVRRRTRVLPVSMVKTNRFGIQHVLDLHWKISTQSLFPDLSDLRRIGRRVTAAPCVWSGRQGRRRGSRAAAGLPSPGDAPPQRGTAHWLYSVHLLMTRLSATDVGRFRLARGQKKSRGHLRPTALTLASTRLGTYVPTRDVVDAHRRRGAGTLLNLSAVTTPMSITKCGGTSAILAAGATACGSCGKSCFWRRTTCFARITLARPVFRCCRSSTCTAASTARSRSSWAGNRHPDCVTPRRASVRPLTARIRAIASRHDVENVIGCIVSLRRGPPGRRNVHKPLERRIGIDGLKCCEMCVACALRACSGPALWTKVPCHAFPTTSRRSGSPPRGCR